MDDFLNIVADQIRWRKARTGLMEELSTHMQEQAEAFMAEGMMTDEAEREAVRQMGDPVTIGTELDHIHRPRPQWAMMGFAVILLAVCGILRCVLIDPITMVSDPWFRGLCSIVLGTIAMLFAYYIDISFLGKWIKFLFPLFCLGVLLLFPITPRLNNAYWMVKQVMLLFPAFLATWIWFQRGRGWRGALCSLIAAGAGLCVAFAIPCTFTVALILFSTLILGVFFSARDWFCIGKKKCFALTVIIATASFGCLVWRRWYFWEYAFFPERAPNSAGYFAFMLRKALSCADWIGTANTAAWEMEQGMPWVKLVPELEGDALLVNMICRFGWLPFLALMIAFAGFFIWAIWKTISLRQSLGKAVAAAAITTLLAQCAASLLVTFGMPIMSASFPLLVGNWAAVLNMSLIGLLLSAFRDDALPQSHAAPKTSRYRVVIKLEKV